ncbi:hypothetical protein KAM448_35040 [Aeromonas caviae]|uniref:Mobilization protein n=2 Tax=Aeromonadaceae TaxID=84642 RepID=A0ABD0B9C2_AERCA|nr:hypothetical protein KAM359_35090 [Aeromonas caviae]GJB11388.1 hypothetical protein KAM362_19480 [Aeromonas caviae]GJB35232.1 hypothetical protein KAM367_43340 [Aeromonas caviae]GJB42199.1 hypothetical protein KAM369_26740 [Aeromonas caviae]GJB47735.1 hypothetical protein KAM370_36770 [Aeromonas caviae]
MSDNRIGYRITDPHMLKEMSDEAKRRGISINEYNKQMAIAGHLAADSRTLIADAMVKTNTITMTTIRRLVQEMYPEKYNEILKNGRGDAADILSKLGIEL